MEAVGTADLERIFNFFEFGSSIFCEKRKAGRLLLPAHSV
jgi:hypothetical protein